MQVSIWSVHHLWLDRSPRGRRLSLSRTAIASRPETEPPLALFVVFCQEVNEILASESEREEQERNAATALQIEGHVRLFFVSHCHITEGPCPRATLLDSASGRKVRNAHRKNSCEGSCKADGLLCADWTRITYLATGKLTRSPFFALPSRGSTLLRS